MQKKEDFEHFVTEHLRISGYYWGLTALDLMNHLPMAEKDILVGWVLSCQHDDGGFGGSPEGDAHLLYTLSALQVLALYDALDKCNRDACIQCTARALHFDTPSHAICLYSCCQIATRGRLVCR